jgi:hypothetical protein
MLMLRRNIYGIAFAFATWKRGAKRIFRVWFRKSWVAETTEQCGTRALTQRGPDATAYRAGQTRKQTSGNSAFRERFRKRPLFEKSGAKTFNYAGRRG